MRRIAVVTLLAATGCAAAPVEEAGEGPRIAPAAVASVGCNTIWDACVLGELVTIGSITLPCGFGIVAACLGGAACVLGCPS